MVSNFTKQMELVDVDAFKYPINVVGAGALGSWLAFFLLKMGFKNIHLYDFDVLEEHNMPNQMYSEHDIGVAKVDAMYNFYKNFFEENEDRLTVHNEKIDPEKARRLTGVVFSCVDSMNARREIYNNCYNRGVAKFWCEGRLSIYGAYIYTLYKDCDIDWSLKYEDTFYEDEEAEVSACGVSQTALPSAVNAATMMVMQMISWFNGESPLNRIEYSIPQMVVLSE